MATATDPPRRSVSRSSGRTALLLATLGASLLLTGVADARAADSISVSASDAPQAGATMTISARGSSTDTSQLRVFVQQGGDCVSGGTGGAAANAARQAVKAGSTEVITAETSPGPFHIAADYTPPAAGAYKICAYIFRSDSAGSMSSQVSQAFSVSEPPPAAPGGTPGTGDAVADTPKCVVPKLKGRMYATARRRLHAAGCIVGKVTRPSRKKAAPVRKGGRRRILKVLSSSPRAGSVLKARGRVALRLVYVTPKTASKIG